MLIEQGQFLSWLYAAILLFFPSLYQLQSEKLEEFLTANPEVMTHIVIIKNHCNISYETTWEIYNNIPPQDRDYQDILIQPLYDLNQLRDLLFNKYYLIYPPDL